MNENNEIPATNLAKYTVRYTAPRFLYELWYKNNEGFIAFINRNKTLIPMPQIAEVSLAYKSTVPVDELPTISSPKQAADYLHTAWNKNTLELREEFVILLLDNMKHVLGFSLISSGGSTATIVDMAAIFQVALLGKAQSIILAHNHPSGNRKPSTADVQLTKRAMDVGKLLGIPIEDHIILFRNGYTSLRDEGLM